MTPDQEQYKETFLAEARANLDEMTAALLAAEGAADKSEPLNRLFRSTHTLKGMAAMMRYPRMVELCHSLEDVLEALRARRLSLAGSADVLLLSLDWLVEMLSAVAKGQAEPEVTSLIGALGALASQGRAEKPVAAYAQPPAAAARSETLPVRVERLDLLMNLAEELLVARLRFDQLRETLRHPDFSAAVDTLDRLASELQYHVTAARMVPLGLIFNRFPRLIRDIAKQQRKEVLFIHEGGDIEVDRVVSDEINEALVHLLRNAVDHGVETPKEREEKGKPRQGTVRLMASRTRDAAVIEIDDDGAGLDLGAIRRVGEKRGLLKPGASDEEAVKTVFSGLSTAAQATPVSGRGLGLDIVRRKTEALGGKVSVASRPGRGATFRLEVPLSVAILKCLFVQAAGKSYAIPMSNIERIVSLPAKSISSALGRAAAVIGGDQAALLSLPELFGAPPAAAGRCPTVIVRRGTVRLGLLVDALVSTQEIVLKPLSPLLREARFFAGSAIVGTGEAVLVLDVAGLFAYSEAEPVA